MYRSWLSLMMLAAETRQLIMLQTLRAVSDAAKPTIGTGRLAKTKIVAANLEGSRLVFAASSHYRRKHRANDRRLSNLH
jgi:hypothetical protein